jgi:hypothetical protein
MHRLAAWKNVFSHKPKAALLDTVKDTGYMEIFAPTTSQEEHSKTLSL